MTNYYIPEFEYLQLSEVHKGKTKRGLEENVITLTLIDPDTKDRMSINLNEIYLEILIKSLESCKIQLRNS